MGSGHWPVVDINNELVELGKKEGVRLEQIDFNRRVRNHKDAHLIMMEISKKISKIEPIRAQYWALEAYQLASTVRSRENLARNWAQHDYQWRFDEIKDLCTENIKSIPVLEKIMEEHNEEDKFIEILAELELENDSPEFDWIQFKVVYESLL